jgi:hypothetical protein
VDEGAAGGSADARGYLVFSQQAVTPAAVNVEAWSAQAERFFDARLGLAEPVREAAGSVELRLVLTPSGGGAGILAVRGRASTEHDRALADAGERLAGGGGLALLARRCPGVWHVERRGDVDPLALRLAAIFASILLGPIVDRTSGEIFGVKTARAKLASVVVDAGG